METGKVKFYNKEKKYGFITGDDGKDYFFHSSIVIMVSFFCAIASITSWCLLGKFLRRFSENKKFIQVFNYTMSFSLIVCVILIYLKI